MHVTRMHAMSGPHGGLREIGGSHAVCNTFVVGVLFHAWPFPHRLGCDYGGIVLAGVESRVGLV